MMKGNRYIGIMLLTKIRIAQIVVGVAIVAVFIWLLILLLLENKYRKKNEKLEEKQERCTTNVVEKEEQMPYLPDEDDERTVVLQDEDDERTMVLQGGFSSGKYGLKRAKNGEWISIDQMQTVIGKSREQVDYVISDNAAISRVHAKLVWKDNMYYLYDMNSSNGTFVNGEKIDGTGIRIKANDSIILADEQFEFVRQGDSRASEL